MKFNTRHLINMIEGWGDYELGPLKDAEVVNVDRIREGRWEATNQVVFRYNGKLYAINIQVPLTEIQDVEDFGLYGEEQECPEVEEYSITVTKYRRISEHD